MTQVALARHLDSYPFSERYGWLEDKYGLSWQLIYTNLEGEERPLIIPSLMFVGDICGKAEEASDFYLSVFKDSRRGALARYPAGMEPEQEGAIMFTDFKLEGQWFVAMDSAQTHDFAFNEAVSLIVRCKDQEEIDAYWDRLSAVPEAEQCGWIKDNGTASSTTSAPATASATFPTLAFSPAISNNLCAFSPVGLRVPNMT